MTNTKYQSLLIAGKNVRSDKTIPVFNPYTKECIGTVAAASPQDMLDAIEYAAAYESQLSKYARGQILQRSAALLNSRKKTLAYQIVEESGLSLKDALHEVGRAEDVLSIAAALCVHEDANVYAGDISAHGNNRKIISFREPVMAIGAITPFNHPLCQVAHKVAPAIATNNCMVLKPSEKTPFSAYTFAEILYEAGLPREMLSVLSGRAADLANVLIENEKIEVLAFTGSTSVGLQLLQKSPYKRLLLELGGNDALVILPDADITEAVDLAVRGAFGNSGQRCTAIKRLLVCEELADVFVTKFVEKSANLKCGNPLDEETDIGTVIDEASAQLIEKRVDAAIKDGARLLMGHKRDGALYEPTVLDYVHPDSELVMQETFGPVAPIIRFRTVDEAIQIINSTAFGLSAGLCTDHWPTIMAFTKKLRVGGINIREIPSYRTEMSPFGGIKGSGLGVKEGLIEAMRFYTNTKTLSLPWSG